MIPPPLPSWVAVLSLTLAVACGGGGGGGADRNLAPVLASFTPVAGLPGASVTLSGSGLAGATEVRFGGVQAPFTPGSDTSLVATVPAGAVSGPIALATPSGSATSSRSFTVLTGTPAITSLSQAEGAAGTLLTITGLHFLGATSVSIGGAPATSFQVASDTLITATVPPDALSGPVAVTSPAGMGTSAPFRVFPVVTFMAPTAGPPGTSVTLRGTGFPPDTRAAFAGTAASVAYVGPQEVHATVPSGAPSGLVTLTTPEGGQASSPSAFTVTSGPVLDLSVGGWYLTQSVQTLSRSVPLVAGRDGCLRVFVLANATNTAAPRVRVTVTGGSPSPWVQTITAPSASVPTVLDEATLASSWNLAIPGAVLAPAGSLRVEVDPDGLVTDGNLANNVVQASLDVRTVNPFRITLVPITQQGLTGNVSSGRSLASWMDRFQRMYPLSSQSGSLDILLGTPLATSANLNSATSTEGAAGWSTCLGELRNKQLLENGSRYYFGVVNVSYGSGVAGLGYRGVPSALGWDKDSALYADGGRYPEVLAHEVGHNLDRMHSPCPSTVADQDASWPGDAAHAGALLGAMGLDIATLTPHSASQTRDIMSYCSPVWASDYTYKAILDFRAASATLRSAEGEAQECLLVSGRIRNGRVDLDPAFQVLAHPSLPEPGPCTLDLEDEGGRVLQSVSFAGAEVADLPGGAERHFAFTLPLAPATASALAGLRVQEGGLDRAALRPTPRKAFRDPALVALGRGRVHLGWDARIHPGVLVRDPRSGEVLAFGREGSLDLDTEARELEVTFSDGVRSLRRTLRADD